jgi:hypothetical protein
MKARLTSAERFVGRRNHASVWQPLLKPNGFNDLTVQELDAYRMLGGGADGLPDIARVLVHRKAIRRHRAGCCRASGL